MYFQTWTLNVNEGQRINITVLDFDIYTWGSSCRDWLEIEAVQYCGEIPTPFTIITNTNSVTMTFKSDDTVRGTGFLAVWTLLDIPAGCNNCDFPFEFGNTIFDSCISVEDVDTQPWCPIKPQVINGLVKIFCFDDDSSCPSTPSKMLITSPNYPQPYPLDQDEVYSSNRN